MTKERIRYIVLGIILLAGAAHCIVTALVANQINGGDGFPLDDPWIHLQFAKNLHDFGVFSYYRNEMITSGSTSPLYTLLLSAGFFVTSNEMLLSYCFGVSFLLLAAIYMFRLSYIEFGANILYAAGAACLLLFEPRLLWISLSGMETTLFVFLLLAVLYYYRSRQPLPLGITAGLLLWTRPEACLFMAIIAIDVLYHAYVVPRAVDRRKSGSGQERDLAWLKLSFMTFSLFALAYVGFNLWLSGSIFPNTFAAKLKYYTGGGETYPLQVFHYITDGHLALFWFMAAIGVVALLAGAARRRRLPWLTAFLWIGGLFLVYWKNLPYLFQEGRYLMPALPFIILLGLGGVRSVIGFLEQRLKMRSRSGWSRAVAALLIGIVMVQFGAAAWSMRVEYAEYCKYISDRQVRTAKWIRDHLPADAVVATHDVGAIAYYSGKRIVDMVGLISPEMIQLMGNLDGLTGFLNKKHATHLAVLRNWFEVDNQDPVFQTDIQHPEIMEVFRYDGKAHILSHDVVQLLQAGQYYISVNDLRSAGPMFQRAAQLDPQSARAHLFLGSAYLGIGKLDEADGEFKAALMLQPSFIDAQAALAEVAVHRNKPLAAIDQLEAIISKHPMYARAYRLLAEVYEKHEHDSVKAAGFLQRFNVLTSQPGQ